MPERAEIIRTSMEAQMMSVALEMTLVELWDEASSLRAEAIRLRGRARFLRESRRP